MTAFSTGDRADGVRRRTAGNAPTDTGGTTRLNAPGVAVQRPVVANSDVQDLNRIFGSITGAVNSIAAATEAERAKAEREEMLRANRTHRDLLTLRQEQIAAGELLAPDGLDTEGVLDFYQQQAESDAEAAGFEGEARAEFVSRMTAGMARAGFAQAAEFRQKQRDDAISRYVSGLSVDSSDSAIDAAVEGIREILPNATDAQVDGYIVEAMQTAAIEGNVEAVNRLAQRVSDTDSQAVARARVMAQGVQSSRAAEEARTASEGTRNAVAEHLMAGNYESARRAVESSSLGSTERLSLLDSIQRREDQATSEAEATAYDNATRELSEMVILGQDTSALDTRFDELVEAGVLGVTDRPRFVDAVRDRRTESMLSTMKVAIKTQDADVAMETMNRVANEALDALEAGNTDPNTFGGITSVQFDRIQRAYRSYVEPIRQEAVERALVDTSLQASLQPGGTYFSSFDQAGVTVSATDLAERTRVAAYRSIEAGETTRVALASTLGRTAASPDVEAVTQAKIDWLARNPQAKDRELAGRLSGAAGRAILAVSNGDELGPVIESVEAYRSLKQQNASVALRHTDEADRTFYETVDVLKRARPGMPMSQAVQLAASASSTDLPTRTQILGSLADQRDLADDHIRNLADSVGGAQVREEFLARVYAASSLLGTMSPDDFASVIADDMKDEYEIIDGAAVYIGGANIDRRGLENIGDMASVIQAQSSDFEADDLAFTRSAATGRWGLIERDTGGPVGGLSLTDNDVARIVSFAQNYEASRREYEADSRARRRSVQRQVREEANRRELEFAQSGRNRADALEQFRQELRDNTHPFYAMLPQPFEPPVIDDSDPLAPFFRMILEDDR